MSIVSLIVDASTISSSRSFRAPGALAVVAERPVALPDRVTPADVLCSRHEIEAFLGVAGDSVEDEAEQPAGVGLVLVTSDVVEHPLHHLQLVQREQRDALRE